ncbi:MAG: CsgG/HfaB family protein [Myxococcota bacterium]
MKEAITWFLLALGAWLAVPAHAGSLEEAGDEAETLILRKLAEDGAYFKWILAEQKAGRTGDLKPDVFEGEVRRAKTLDPVLESIVESAREQREGERVDVVRVRKAAPTTYTQLALYLNLIGTLRSHDYLRAQALADQIDLKVGFGPTQSIEGYRVALTRHYYYLRAVALYHVQEDAKAVQWFGQIDADTEVRAMNLPRKKEIETLRLADLNTRPIAVASFTSQKGEGDENAWVGVAVSDAVTNDLVGFTDLQVVERTRLQSVMDELSLGLMGVVDEKHAVELGQMLEAGTLVFGSFNVSDEVVTLTGRLVHVESGAVLQSAMVKGDLDHLFETSRELTSKLLGDAGLVTAVQKLKIAGARAPSGSAVRAVAKARLMAASNPDAAKALYEEAMKSDPQYANAHEALRAQFADVSAKVAILPLNNTTGQEADAWLSDGLAELLGRDLPVLGFATVERAEMRKVMAYQLALMGAEDAGGTTLEGGALDLAAMGEQVAANFLVLGGFQHLGDDLKVSLRFVDVGSGEVLYTAGADGKLKDYGKVVSDVVADLAKHVGRGLDADALAKLVEGKPSLEEFERFMRAEIAKDALAAEDAVAEAEQEKRAEDAEDHEKLAAVLQERIDAASARVQTRNRIAAGVGVAGLGIAAVGIGAGEADRQKAGEFLALANNAIRQEDADSNLAESKSYHRRATTWQVVGLSGVGLALGATGVMVVGGKVKPDLNGVELAGASKPGWRVGVAPGVDGATATVAAWW